MHPCGSTTRHGRKSRALSKRVSDELIPPINRDGSVERAKDHFVNLLLTPGYSLAEDCGANTFRPARLSDFSSVVELVFEAEAGSGGGLGRGGARRCIGAIADRPHHLEAPGNVDFDPGLAAVAPRALLGADIDARRDIPPSDQGRAAVGGGTDRQLFEAEALTHPSSGPPPEPTPLSSARELAIAASWSGLGEPLLFG